MLYRRLTFGQLAELNMLDTRQYRDDQVAGDGWKADSDARRDPKRTIAGEQQTRWLLDGVRASGTTWNLLANQVIMSRLDLDPTDGNLYNMDAWDGYPAEQQRVLAGLAELRARNPVVLTGDVHVAYAMDMKCDFADPTSKTFGVELVATSVSSGGNGSDLPGSGQRFLDANPHLRFVNGRRGYFMLRMTPQELRADFRTVPYVDRPGAPVSTVRSFVVEAGDPGLNLT
jgi:alkaline phosphatase D